MVNITVTLTIEPAVLIVQNWNDIKNCRVVRIGEKFKVKDVQGDVGKNNDVYKQTDEQIDRQGLDV